MRLSLLAVAAFAAAGGAVVFVHRGADPAPPEAGPAPRRDAPSLGRATPAAPAPSAPIPDRAPAQATPPSFDVVHVTPEGRAVIAGRAEPGAEVVVRDGERELGRVRADDRGEWVLLPAAPLPPGARELSLVARTPSGVERRGADGVLLAVPGRQEADRAASAVPAPLAVLVPQAGAPRVLQSPDAARDTPRDPGRAGSSRLGLDAVDYDERGEVRFAGSAPANAPVRVYVDDAPAGDAAADAQGRWTLMPSQPVPPGLHRLRVDQLTLQGRVAARVELPFQRSAAPPSELSRERVVVQPGQNLWRLARQAYGSGVRYTVIYRANQDQIRDPGRIYPGQTFKVPGAAR